MTSRATADDIDAAVVEQRWVWARWFRPRRCRPSRQGATSIPEGRPGRGSARSDLRATEMNVPMDRETLGYNNTHAVRRRRARWIMIGHGLWWRRCRLTESRTAPTRRPWPRSPTTTSCASVARSASNRAGGIGSTTSLSLQRVRVVGDPDYRQLLALCRCGGLSPTAAGADRLLRTACWFILVHKGRGHPSS